MSAQTTAAPPLKILAIRSLWGVWSAVLLAEVLAASGSIGSWLMRRPAPVVGRIWQSGSLFTRLGLVIVSLLVIVALVEFTRRLYLASRPDTVNTAAIVSAVQKTGAETKTQISAVGELLSVQIEALGDRLAPVIQSPKPSEANVRAPNGFPLARPFVGRRDQLDQLKTQLRKGTTTGVTALRGMGGIGKTALAAQAVSDLAEEPDTFPGHALWIACENLRGPEGLSDLWLRVASALDVSLANVSNPAGALNAALQNRPRTLVALDNIEAEQRETGPGGREVTLPALDIRAALDALAVPGHTVVLLTARQALAPDKVTDMRVDQLPPPDDANLFIERLDQQTQGKRPTAEDRTLIPALARDLGGLPLAIELTAAYAAGQDRSLAAVAEELKRDGVNAAAFQSDPERAITKRFERSVETLDERQRLLFAGLSLCAGPSFPRAAAVALATAIRKPDAEELPEPGPEAELDVSALVRFALVEPLSGDRLRLHPLLRDYASKRLAALPAETRHKLGSWLAAYWLAYAEANPGYEGMDALEAEAENLMGAVEWARDNSEHATVIAFAYALNRFLFVRGRVADARKIRPWAVDASVASGDQRAELSARHEQAVLDAQTGNLASARAGYLRALALAEALGDKRAIQAETHGLAVLDARTGNPTAARAGYLRALQLAEELGDKRAIWAETHELAVLDAQTGNIAAARVGYARALALAEELGDKRAIQAETHELAVLDARTGNIAAARAGYARALALAEELGDKSAIQRETHELAVLDVNEGKNDAARQGLERSLELGRELGDPSAVASDLKELGYLLGYTGEPQRGREMLTEAMRIYTDLGDVFNLGVCHEYWALLDEDEGNRDGAIQHYQQALALYEQVQARSDIEDVKQGLLRLGAG